MWQAVLNLLGLGRLGVRSRTFAASFSVIIFRRVIIQEVRNLSAGRSLSICVLDDGNPELRFLSSQLSCAEGCVCQCRIFFKYILSYIVSPKGQLPLLMSPE